MREGDMTRKQKMKQVVCPNCGGSHELPVGYQITNHKNVSVCLGILTRRAEAAEAERDDLRDANGVLSEALEAARSTLEALTARVAELEAQLAAAHLNPYNTAPLGEHVIVTLRTKGWRDEDGLWDWDDYGDWDVVGWQPLPPAPDTETTP